MRMNSVRSCHKIHRLNGARSFSLFFSWGILVLLFVHHSSQEVFGALGEVTVEVPEIASRQLINSQGLCKGWGYCVRF